MLTRCFSISCNKYRSVQELRSSSIASFSGTFYLILFQAVNFEFIVEKVWFVLVCIDGLNKQKINGFWFALIEFGLVCLIEFGLVWFANSTDTQTKK